MARKSDRAGAALVRVAAMHDCSTIEINPLAQLRDGTLMAADAKVAHDEWARFRNEEIHGMRQARKRAPTNCCATCLDMQHMYVRLDGDIGLISGGAGMTMAAMDMIAEQGGRPRAFSLQPGSDIDARISAGVCDARWRSER